MKRIANNFFAAAALLTLGAAAAAACPLTYVMNFSGQFGLMDLATGTFTPIGPGLENTPDGIAGTPGGPFYTIDGVTGHLLRITLDGKVSDVGDTHTGGNVAPNGISVIGSLTNGTLYALDFSNRLYRVDKNTAAMTLVAKLPLPDQEMDYSGNMTTSLNGDGDKLYYTLEISEGPRKTGPTLFMIDPVTIIPNQVYVISRSLKLPGRIIGSGLVNGTLFAFTDAGQIVKINPDNGTSSTVSEYDSGLTDDTPPFTGIFGVIAAVEPNAMRDPGPIAPKVRGTQSHWPPRYAPRPHSVR